MKIGIIAEDDSDVAVIVELTFRLVKRRNIGTSRFVGHGCGKLRRKCGAWAANLVQRGCHAIIAVHDLDDYDEQSLRNELTKAVRAAKPKLDVVLIPKRELEAWLLYDANAIALVFRNSRRPNLPGDPESVGDPKRFLRELVRRTYRREYLNTVHNAEIAKHIELTKLKKSHSFLPHITFSEKLRDLLN